MEGYSAIHRSSLTQKKMSKGNKEPVAPTNSAA